MASIAGWWAIPAVALLVIVVWTAWRGRTRRPPTMHDTVGHYEAFQAVLTRVVEAEPRSPAGAGGKPGARRNTAANAGGHTDPNADEPRAAGRRDVP
ncbi:hypothetical protein [Yinghuangia sp. YIM S09857]|uniref:hypothetical protein n=1 Tax=Yinghuangia sp. YIM S09857 TaxID=3436929 RepID=UPI003F53B373